MDKDLSRDVGKMQNGIRGFYRSKRFKTRVIALVLVLVVLIGVACGLLFIRDNTWTGKVYIIPYTESVYKNNFYRFSEIKKLLEEREMTSSSFERLANVTVIPRNTITDIEIESYGLKELLPSASELRAQKSVGRVTIILMDGKSNVLYQADDSMRIAIAGLIEALNESGF